LIVVVEPTASSACGPIAILDPPKVELLTEDGAPDSRCASILDVTTVPLTRAEAAWLLEWTDHQGARRWALGRR
jgi:hypothetical protein